MPPSSKRFPGGQRLWLDAGMMLAERRRELLAIVRGLQGRAITVVGDPVLDCYLYGTTHRISREAPVLIVREDLRDLRLGGAANTAANLASLGVQARLFGLIGNDHEGSELVRLAAEAGIDTQGLVRRRRGPTITKTRVLAGGRNTRKQQMLRIDRESDEEASADDVEALRAVLEAAPLDDDAIIVSDYGAGGQLTALYAAFAQERYPRQVVVVDSRYALSAYRRVTAVTPNEPEVEAALGVALESEANAIEAAGRLTEALELEMTVVTRGRAGMVVAPSGAPPISLPAHGQEEAVDVTGAGDTVAATFTAALSAKASPLDAALLANCAGSIVVRAVGAVSCSAEALAREIESVG